MDPNRAKRRSFPKSKLIKSLYRAAKPSAAAQPHYGSKPPKPSAATDSWAAPFEFGVANQPSKPKQAPPPAAAAGSALSFLIVNQEQVFPQPPPKVAFVVAERNLDSYGRLENFYGVAADEGVDAKAAKYISAVQERFRLERVGSERENFQQIIL